MASNKRLIGFVAGYGDARSNVERIVRLEQLGVPAAWLTTGGFAPDGLTTLAAAASATKSIMLGSSITPIWPRHPIAVVQQTLAIASLAPERFRLGLGSGGKRAVEGTFGYKFDAPLSYMREYAKITQDLLHQGFVDFDGRHLHAHAKLSGNPPKDVPVMIAALSTKSFESYARFADGLISWVCPPNYLRDKALPAMRIGAKSANRDVPPLIAHVPICLSMDKIRAYAAVREQIGVYPSLQTYQTMFTEAGFAEVKTGIWSDAMIDNVVAIGSEDQIMGRLEEIFSYGVAEVIAHPIVVGDKAESYQATMAFVANANKAIR